MTLIKKITNLNLEYLLLFCLIMTYPIQVYLQSMVFSYFVYGAIFVYTFLFWFQNRIDIFYNSVIDKLLIVFLILILLNIFREFYIYKDIFNFLRILILYIVTTLFMYILIYNKNTFKINKTWLSIGTATIIIALELIYEFIYSDVTWFEQANFNYVYKISSLQLYQLLGGLRNNGLMDHIHVTAIFISFGIIISTSIYLFHQNSKFKIFNLFCLILLYTALILIGVRLVLIYTFIWFLFIFILGPKDIKIKIVKLHILFIILFLILCVLTFSYKSYFWSAIYLQYLPKEILDYFGIYELVIKLGYQNDSVEAMKNIDLVTISNDINNINIVNLLFGTGFGKLNMEKGFLSDDLYFIQLFFSLGVINSIIFSTICFVTLINILRLLFLNQHMVILFGIFLVLLLSISHSGVFIRKQVFPLFFFSIFMIDFYCKLLVTTIQKDKTT